MAFEWKLMARSKQNPRLVVQAHRVALLAEAVMREQIQSARKQTRLVQVNVHGAAISRGHIQEGSDSKTPAIDDAASWNVDVCCVGNKVGQETLVSYSMDSGAGVVHKEQLVSGSSWPGIQSGGKHEGNLRPSRERSPASTAATAASAPRTQATSSASS